MWLFGSRDAWFEVAAPIYLVNVMHWNGALVGSIMAGYIIIYGQLQGFSGNLVLKPISCMPPRSKDTVWWAVVLLLFTSLLGAVNYVLTVQHNSFAAGISFVVGVFIFALVFAVNSAIHSYLIVVFSNKDKVAQ